MKLYALGEVCHVLTFKNTNIMLDCALDWGGSSSSWDFMKRNVIPIEFSASSKTILNFSRTSRLSDSSPTDTKHQREITPSIVFKCPNFHKFDATQIDIILITNPHNLLALPFFFQHLKQKIIFQNKDTETIHMPTIYATEPTIQLGKKMMQELLAYVKQSEHMELSSLRQANKTSTEGTPTISSLFNEKYIYSSEDIISVVENMKSVSYQERISVFGGVFQIAAVSSGYSLGYCNWLIQTEYEKIFYVGHSSRAGAQVRHPSEMDLSLLSPISSSSSAPSNSVQDRLSMVNTVMIMSNISPKSERNVYFFEQYYQQIASSLGAAPSKGSAYAIETENIKVVKPTYQYYPEAALNDFCKIIGKTIESGGDVLIPCHTTGLIYDLIDFLSTFFQSINLGSTLFYVISPVADHSIQYANISAEWLCDSKMDKTLTAESPFTHVNLMQNKYLMTFDSVNAKFMQVYQNNRTTHPCVIFAGHPSLRMGDILQLIPIFQRNTNNAMICIEPEYSFFDTVEPFLSTSSQPSMKFIHCPIDLRLRNNDIIYMLKQIVPQHLVLTNVSVDIQPQQKTLASPNTELMASLNGYNTSSTVLNCLDMRTISKFVTEKVHVLSPTGSSAKFGIDGDDVLSIKKHHMKRKYELATISPDLANTIYPKPVKGVFVSRISASLSSRNGRHVLELENKNETQQRKKRKQDLSSNDERDLMVFGDISVEKIVKHLQVEGFEFTVQTKASEYGTYLIEIPQLESRIIFNAEDTTIEAPDESSRLYLKQLLMQNLYML